MTPQMFCLFFLWSVQGLDLIFRSRRLFTLRIILGNKNPSDVLNGVCLFLFLSPLLSHVSEKELRSTGPTEAEVCFFFALPTDHENGVVRLFGMHRDRSS